VRPSLDAKTKGLRLLLTGLSPITTQSDKSAAQTISSIPLTVLGGVLTVQVIKSSENSTIGCAPPNTRVPAAPNFCCPSDQTILEGVPVCSLSAVGPVQLIPSVDSICSLLELISLPGPLTKYLPRLGEWTILDQVNPNVEAGVTLRVQDAPSVDEPIKEEPIVEASLVDPEPEGGGCLIATATFGSELAPQVQYLREIRDNTLLSTASGVSFMSGFNQLYYSFSPMISDMERENPAFKEAVKLFITPMLSTLSIMTLADSGSEAEVLGLGISVIALNLAIYIAAPAIVPVLVMKRLKQ